MQNKTFLPYFLLLVVSVVFGASLSFDWKNAECIIDAPDSIEIGELAKIDISQSVADTYHWQILPETENFIVTNNNQIGFFSSSKPGIYTFICSVSKGGTVDSKLHKIEIIGHSSIDIDPIKPIKIEDIIRSWVPRNAEAKDIKILARSFELVAGTNHTSIETLVEHTIVSNKAALGKNVEDWESFFDNLQTYLQTKYDHKSLKDHLSFWRKISEVLNDAA